LVSYPPTERAGRRCCRAPLASLPDAPRLHRTRPPHQPTARSSADRPTAPSGLGSGAALIPLSPGSL